MFFFFVGGVRPRARPTGETRVGSCGHCGGEQLFEAIRLRPHFELFFLPLFPLGPGRPAWRCTGCQTLRADARATAQPPTTARPFDDAFSREGEPGDRPFVAPVRAPGSGSGGRAATRPEPTLGTRESGVRRFCHHCGSQISASPSEAGTPGLRRYHCDRCGRDFEVVG